MKTIEEKARAYDEALEKAREYWETDNDNTLDIKAKGTMEYLFPELAESGDEIIKEELINYLKHRCNSTTLSGEERACNKWIDWLEKQDSNLVENGYTNNKDVIKYAGNYSHAIWHKLMDNFKNIKDYHIGCNDVSDIVLNAIINTYNWIEKQGEQKSAEWSEEDETKIKSIITFLKSPSLCAMDGNKGIIDENIKYLKSLKDRVQPQPKQEWKQENREELTEFENAMMHIGSSFFGENAGLDPNDTDTIKEQAELLLELAPKTEWSEEDESMYTRTLGILGKCYMGKLPTKVEEELKWFKLLKQIYTWKPSDEQMEALWCATEKYLESDNANVVELRGKVLESLYNELKKLKGE